MAPRVVLRSGLRVYRVDAAGRVESTAPLGPSPSEAARQIASGGSGAVPESVDPLFVKAPGESLVFGDPLLLAWARTSDPAARLASFSEARAAREAIPRPPPVEERNFLLALATEGIERALRDPIEVLVSLSREEERVERARDRELAASDHWLDAGTTPLSEYAQDWRRFRERYDEHHATLGHRVDALAKEVAPNLSELVGPRVAARLVSAGGGRDGLARISSARLQLLGARRRPSGARGPRYGLIYRAVGMADVPADRQGAYARTLAALAVIAARADARGTDLGRLLVQRRDRRIERLRRRGR